MKRLTFDGCFCDIAQCRELPCPYDGMCSQRKVWERLKEYEDAGLEPERCAEFARADAEGRYIVMRDDVRGKLVELLAKYFDIGDSYSYNITRSKSAFACGTMGFDDFEEFDEETVADIADHLIANGVTVQDFGLVNDMNNGERCNFENNHDAICGSTNLPCIKCNPGGCNNRKEGTGNG